MHEDKFYSDQVNSNSGLPSLLAKIQDEIAGLFILKRKKNPIIVIHSICIASAEVHKQDNITDNKLPIFCQIKLINYFEVK